MATTRFINKKMAVASISYSDISSIAAHTLPLALPNGAIITNVFYSVGTTFTSATDAATIALHLQSANDIVAALAISNAANIWDAGLHSTKIPYGANSTYTATALTSVAPSGTDFALQAITTSSPAGFATADEGGTAAGALVDIQTLVRRLQEKGTPTPLKLTANRTLTATVAVEALTAGAMDIFVEYILP
jgi:hypothetical protein